MRRSDDEKIRGSEGDPGEMCCAHHFVNFTG